MNNVLRVYWEQNTVGDLRLNEKRDFVFQYNQDWLANPKAMPISIRLPLQANEFTDEFCRTFFVNLLPVNRQQMSS